MATTKKNQKTTDQKIDSLAPGATIELSRNDRGVRVVAERSGDGERVRIVRIYADGERVLGFVVMLNQRW
ncbi:MAG: hypothetical protein LAO51_01580 [Acidobacteriia bacterium]|nr:hypothetical protein [Terriglobia bacterium]